MGNRLHHLLFWLFLLVCFSIFADEKSPSTEKTKADRLTGYRKVMPLIISEDTLHIKPSWFVPDHFKLQYAGLIGFMSLGAGYDLSPRYDLTLFYGVLSNTLGGSSVRVHTVSLKNSWDLFKPRLLGNVTPKAGVSINWGHTNNTFRRLPPHYPESYYFQNKVHLAPFWGLEWQLPLSSRHVFKSIGIYGEMSTLDAYLLEFMRTQYVSLDKIWNLALGITLYMN
jgi:hypothetical protein